MKKFRYPVLAFAALTAFSPVVPVFAEPAAPKIAMLEERLAALEQEVRILRRQLEVKNEEAAAKTPDTPVVTASAKDGFGIKAPDDSFRLKIRGYVQADGRLFTDDKKDIGTTDTFVARRVRPIVEGTVQKNFDFLIMPELGSGSVSLLDGYVEYREYPWARLRAGKFKPPFGLERLQSSTTTNFGELGLPSLLAPSRDAGVMLHGDVLDNTLYYALGAFNGAADFASSGASDVDTNNDKGVAARIFAHPFRNTGVSSLTNLGAGAAFSHSHNEGAQLPTLRSPGNATIFSYNTGVTADGPHTRVGPQAYWYWNNVGVLGEYTVSSQEVGRAATGQYEKIENDAWQVTGTYVLTGEDATYKGVNPANPFDIQKGWWGAWELAWRYGELEIDDDALGGLGFANPNASVTGADSWGLGLNWYLNRSVKAVLNFDRTLFDGAGPLGEDRETENVVLGRFQIAY